MVDAAKKLGETVHGHPGLRARLDPVSATGSPLPLALVFAGGAGIVLGLLAALVRTNARLIGLDDAVAKWGRRHATSLSTHALNGVTEFGVIYVILGLCVVVELVETWRTRSRWIVPFLVVAGGGEEILTTVTKQVVDRARPTLFNPPQPHWGRRSRAAIPRTRPSSTPR